MQPQVAYLAASLFLNYKSDTIILVVNTLQNDLKSDNFLVGECLSPRYGHAAFPCVSSTAVPFFHCLFAYAVVCKLEASLVCFFVLAVCTALSAVCKLISPDLINAVLPSVLELLNHPKELVRKKAIMALHRFMQLDPNREGPLANMDFDKQLRTALCDKVCRATQVS